MEQRPEELTSDEVWLLKLISTGEPKTPSKVDAAVKTNSGFQDLRAMLRSLRHRGFIYYFDWNEVVIALPKAYQYLATSEASSETNLRPSSLPSHKKAKKMQSQVKTLENNLKSSRNRKRNRR